MGGFRCTRRARLTARAVIMLPPFARANGKMQRTEKSVFSRRSASSGRSRARSHAAAAADWIPISATTHIVEVSRYACSRLGTLMRMTRCGFGNTSTATGRPSGRSSARSSPPVIPTPTTPAGRPSRPGRSGSRRLRATPSSPATDRGCSGTAKMGPNRPGPGSHVATASFMVAGRCAGPRSRARAWRVRALLGTGAGVRRDAVQRRRGIEPRRRATLAGTWISDHRDRSRGVRAPDTRPRRSAHHAPAPLSAAPLPRCHFEPAGEESRRPRTDAAQSRNASNSCFSKTPLRRPWRGAETIRRQNTCSPIKCTSTLRS